MSCSEEPQDVTMNESLEAVQCPCGVSEESQQTLEVTDCVSGKRFSYEQCSHCGLEYLNPRPTQEAIGDYYPDNYYAYDPGVVKPERFGHFVERLIYRVFYAPANDLSLVFRFLRYPMRLLLFPVRKRTLLAFRQPTTKRVFEIGAAMGRDLMMFRDKGWEPAGCEPSEQACNISRSHGLDVQNCQAEFFAAFCRKGDFLKVVARKVSEESLTSEPSD